MKIVQWKLIILWWKLTHVIKYLEICRRQFSLSLCIVCAPNLFISNIQCSSQTLKAIRLWMLWGMSWMLERIRVLWNIIWSWKRLLIFVWIFLEFYFSWKINWSNLGIDLGRCIYITTQIIQSSLLSRTIYFSPFKFFSPPTIP